MRFAFALSAASGRRAGLCIHEGGTHSHTSRTTAPSGASQVLKTAELAAKYGDHCVVVGVTTLAGGTQTDFSPWQVSHQTPALLADRGGVAKKPSHGGNREEREGDLMGWVACLPMVHSASNAVRNASASRRGASGPGSKIQGD